MNESRQPRPITYHATGPTVGTGSQPSNSEVIRFNCIKPQNPALLHLASCSSLHASRSSAISAAWRSIAAFSAAPNWSQKVASLWRPMVLRDLFADKGQVGSAIKDARSLPTNPCTTSPVPSCDCSSSQGTSREAV